MRFAIPAAAFFLSGASSLIFQSLWTRLLHHVFGSTSVAMSSVLTVFMGGLGLGAFIAGRYVDRIKRPLFFYALAEAGVAICGVLIPLLVQPEGWLASVNAYLRQNMGADSGGFLVARFLCVVPILIIPTTLMGATLPLLARHFIDREAARDDATMSAGTLYAINTAGAIVGTFFAGFVLMPKYGLAAANWAAVATNALLAIVVGLWSRRPTRAPSFLERRPVVPKELAPDREPEPPSPEPFAATPLARRLALAAFAASGAAALCYEVVWTRALAMVLGSSIYSFTLILITFLTGIAAGSAFLASCLAARPTVWAPTAAALLLTAFAHVPLGLAQGAGVWFVITALCAVPIVAAALYFHAKPRPILAKVCLLSVPILSALAEAFAFPGSWSKIALSVIATVSAFLVLPRLLARRPFTLLALIQVFIGVATFVSYAWQDSIPGSFARHVAKMPDLPNQVGTVQFFMLLTAAVCTLPATLGMGAMFPLTLRLWAPGGASIARDIGVVYTVNTLGSLVGAWLPGFILLPLIGMERTLQIALSANFALGAVLLALAFFRASPRPRWAAAAGVVALLASVAAPAGLYAGTADRSSPLSWRQHRMTLGAFRVSRMRELETAAETPPPDIIYYRDGVSTTVTVERADGYHSLKNNGKADASDVPGGDMFTQVALAGFPLLLHPRDPEGLDVAIIGFGSGVTVGTALRFPVKQVDAIELEPAVLEASRFFAKSNDLQYTDAAPFAKADRLKIHLDDARNYLAATDAKYDLIISEPSNPWITGVSDLFTQEHFRISKRRLRAGGLYVQWVQLYEVSPENIKSIYRTFASQFEHVLVMAAAPYFDDTLLIGSDSPLGVDLDTVARRLAASPQATLALARADILSAYELPARILLKSKDEVLRYAQLEERFHKGQWTAHPESDNSEPESDGIRRTPAPLNTDDNARIEFAAPRDLIGYERYAGYTSNFFAEDWPYGRFDGFKLPPDARAPARYAELAISFAGCGRLEEAAAFLEASEAAGGSHETDVAARVLTIFTEDEPSDPEFTVSSNDAGIAMNEEEVKAMQKLFDEVSELIDDDRFDDAVEKVDEFTKARPRLDVPPVKLLRAFVYYRAGAELDPPWEEAIQMMTELAKAQPAYAQRHPEIFYFAARAFERAEQFPPAVRWMRRYAELRLEAEAKAPPEPATTSEDATPTEDATTTEGATPTEGAAPTEGASP